MTSPLDPRENAASLAAGLGDFAAAMRLEREAEGDVESSDASVAATLGGLTSGEVPLAVPLKAESDAPVPPESEQPTADATRAAARTADAPLVTAPAPRRDASAARRSTASRTAGAANRTPTAPGVARSTPDGLIVTPQGLLLGLVGTLFILMFVLIEPSPRWVVLLGTAATTFGMEGVLRSGRRQAFAEGGLDTAPFLLLPALYMLVIPVFIEHATLGFATPLSALFAGVGYGALVIGTLSSVREFDPARDRGRLIAASATYFVAFALFALVFLFGVGQRPATVAVALASVVLAAEILREGEIDPAETLLYSLVVGVVIGETRWVLHYLPVDAYAGALTLLLAFYVSTGLLHSYVVRALTHEVARTYASVGIAGVVFIAAARGVGLT